MLLAAALPAMVTSPKEFIEACTTTLDMAKSTPWNPEGRPTRSMLLKCSLFTPSFFKLSLKPSSSLSRHLITNAADKVCAMAVAAATPATLMLSAITNTKSNTTLVTPAASKKKRGLFVSPLALKIALPKL